MIFDVLMYLFENYMDGNLVIKANPEILMGELEQAGFHKLEIDRALDWLDGLNRMQESVQAGPFTNLKAMRHYSPDECEQLGVTGRGFLLYLEQIGILDPVTREIVVDRVMALDRHEVDPSRMKWIVLIALFNQPDKKSALTLLQDMILSDAFGSTH